MNIILIGASRAGKTTFTDLLQKEYSNLMIIRTDLLRLAFREAICKDTSISINSLKENKDYTDYILSYYKYANKHEHNYIIVLDTVDFEPKDYELFKNSITICLGYPNISKEEALCNWKKYDTLNDWTKRKSDEELLKFAEGEINYSKYLKQECDKYGVKFVDTSYDRDNILKDLVKYVLDIIEKGD